ncbi:flagellar hook-length control protein FliK [Candidatus Margulisiibacteriota bacterium]
MTEQFAINFSKNNTANRLKPESVSGREDQANQASFEEELSVANDVTSKKEQELTDLKESDNLTLIGNADFFQKIFTQQVNNKAPLSSRIDNENIVQDQVNPEKNEDAASSITDMAKQANQKVFTDITPYFARVLVANGKEVSFLPEKLYSDFAIAKVNIGQVIEELVQRVQFLREGEVTHLKLDLKPDNLGRLHVLLSLQDKKLVLHVFASDDAKKILDSQLDDLQEALAEQGFDIAHLEVEVSGQKNSSQHNQEGYFSLDNGKKVRYQDYDMLKIVHQADIIDSLDHWLNNVMVNYIA